MSNIRCFPIDRSSWIAQLSVASSSRRGPPTRQRGPSCLSRGSEASSEAKAALASGVSQPTHWPLDSEHGAAPAIAWTCERSMPVPRSSGGRQQARVIPRRTEKNSVEAGDDGEQPGLRRRSERYFDGAHDLERDGVEDESADRPFANVQAQDAGAVRASVRRQRPGRSHRTRRERTCGARGSERADFGVARRSLSSEARPRASARIARCSEEAKTRCERYAGATDAQEQIRSSKVD